MQLLASCVFPPVRWWLAAMNESVVIPLNENYIKQSYRNRYDISDAHGIRTLTVPVIGQKGQKTSLNDIQLADGKWRREHLGALRSAYGKAPWFEHYFFQLEGLYAEHHSLLIDFAKASQQLLAKWVKAPLPSYHVIAKENWNEDLHKQLMAFEPGTRCTTFRSYPHVFMDRQPFHSDLSVIDVVMNLGPSASDYLLMLKKDQ